MTLTTQELKNFNLTQQQANQIIQILNENQTAPETCWQKVLPELRQIEDFNLHQMIYTTIYPDWDHLPSPAWFPDNKIIDKTNIFNALKELKLANYAELHHYSVNQFENFWDYTIKKLAIKFHKPYKKICDLAQGITKPNWLVDAKLNIIESCFHQDTKNSPAIIYSDEAGNYKTFTYDELDKLSNRVANGLVEQGFKPNDAIAIDMPMNWESVVIYLGIIKAGCVVISIADSFAPDEISTRLRITKTKAIFTQDYILRANKRLPLYEKVVKAHAPQIIVLADDRQKLQVKLRENDISWEDFLSENESFKTQSCSPETHSNILFSSGTTGDPKAIPWTHTTPIKCASDAFYHHDIKANDILAWPTNLGWMMGPWLIYASLINHATMALFDGAPHGKSFGEFVAKAKVTMLGVVPSLVRYWREHQTMAGFDWQSIKLFSSTAECSNPEDMFYLMYLANYRPVIEYCGGTEIGGAYITGTLVQPSAPSTFTSPTLGLDFVMLDENGHLTDNGEVALIPPSIGLSNELLNRDHEKVYYADMPKTPDGKTLRRHGDHIFKMAEHYYRAEGRIDDTMKLGGIKVSSAEIERVLDSIPEISEAAAVAVAPKHGGPSRLVVFVVLQKHEKIANSELKTKMQKVISETLNPLFKIHDLIIVESLPRTASNKVMRRVLRDQYLKTNIC